MKSISFAFIFLSLLVTALQDCNGQSVLSQGKWRKISVGDPGVYKISFDLFKKMGFDPSSTNPKKIRIHGNRGGMLPQENSASRPSDLEEIAILIEGEADGKFDRQDFILFYGEGSDQVTFDPVNEIFNVTNNLYADDNFYFITVGDTDGKRIQQAASQSGGSLVTEFDDYFFHELDEHNELHSGREWYGEKSDGTTDAVIPVNLPDVVAGSDLKISSEVMGQSFQTTTFSVLLNEFEVGKHNIEYIPSGIYSVKGKEVRNTFLVNESKVSASLGEDHTLRYHFEKKGSFSHGYLNKVVISFKRNPILSKPQQFFTSSQSVHASVSRFEIETNESATVWDITDPSNILVQTTTSSGGKISFSAVSTSVHNYIVFNGSVPAATDAGEVPVQDLHGLSTPNLIIVTNPLFETEAERLAQHRRSESGWTVEVVTTNEVFNEFSSGRQDISAIRDFTKFLFDQDPSALKALLLFGRGSYDYKNRTVNNTNYVPIYESRNSLTPLETYGSDDFYGFLEASEGSWSESPIVNHTLDIGVGRLPVTTPEQARIVVDKIIYLEQQQRSHSPWRKRIVFVADDGNSEDEFDPLHQDQSNELASQLQDAVPGIDAQKLFMGTYKKIVKPNGETVPEMEDDLVRAFNDGSVIINFTGHGSEKLWTDERILTDVVIDELENEIYPFLITATCEFGRNDDPFQTSSAEASVTHENGGSIGIVTTTRPVNAYPNFSLNQAFYEALVTIENNQYRSLGQVFRQTKNQSFSGVSNRNFMLLADPSMTVALPANEVIITSAKTASGSDTLKALSTVIVKGEVRNHAEEKLAAFNGVAEVIVYDKETEFITTGRNIPQFQFREWHNVLFRGKATVTAGEFEMEFILPKNIAYTIAEGRLSGYASSDDLPHAMGSTSAVKIGGTEPDYAPDNKAPELRAFLGDTSFVDGGLTAPNTDLIVRLKDESGINISDYGLGTSLQAILDGGEQVFILNSYYVADTDNFTAGTVVFPLRNLFPGKHTLTIKGWDVHNNPATTTLNFVVSEDENLRIEEFGAYPNPAVDQITLFFTHNSSGDDLEAQVFIYSMTGRLMFTVQQQVLQSQYMTELITVDNSDKKLPAGLYVARMVVRSLTNGSKNEQVTKLIILN